MCECSDSCVSQVNSGIATGGQDRSCITLTPNTILACARRLTSRRSIPKRRAAPLPALLTRPLSIKMRPRLRQHRNPRLPAS